MLGQNKYSLVELLPAVTIFVVLFLVSLSMHTLAETPTNNTSIFEDRDQDGLSDEEEEVFGTDPLLEDTDGDSYSDSVEIKSGYNPLIPAPNDRMKSLGLGGEDPLLFEEDRDNAEGNSATDVFTEDLNEYLEEKLENGNEEISVDELTAIANASVADAITYEDLPEISIENIIIKEQDYNTLSEDEREEKERQDAIEYFTASAYILFSHLPSTPSGSTDIMEILDYVTNNVNTIGTADPSPYLSKLADSGDAALEELNNIAVPEEYIELHIRGLQLAGYGSLLSENIKMSETDPLSTISALSQIQGLFSLSSEYVSEMNTIFEDINILGQEIEL